MPTDFKQAIKEFPIRRWLVESGLKTGDLSREKVRADCPHCGGRDTLEINQQFRNCRCYRCDHGDHGGQTWSGRGGLLDLISLVEGISHREAIERVLELADYPDGISSERLPKQKQISIPQEAIPLDEAYDEHPSREVLRRRGLEHMQGRIYLCVEGKYADRWILPVRDLDDQLVGFEAKSFLKHPTKSLSMFPTGVTIYCTPAWDLSQDFVVITESIFDAETLRTNAAGIFGSVLHPGQLVQLLELRKRRGVRRLVWMLDPDAAAKQRRAALQMTGTMFTNYVAEIPSGDDPNSLGYQKCWDLVAHAVPVGGISDFLRIGQ